jgi:tellurite resistance protein
MGVGLMVFERLFDEDGAADEPPMPSEQDPDRDVASIRGAISELGALPVERRRFLAGYAYILVRIARADEELGDAELERIEAAVIAAGDLTEAQAALLVSFARRMNSLYGATEDYAVTREFARMSSPQHRQRLLRACVAVAVADGAITAAEATELHEIGQELHLRADEVDAIREQLEPHEPEPPSEEG